MIHSKEYQAVSQSIAAEPELYQIRCSVKSIAAVSQSITAAWKSITKYHSRESAEIQGCIKSDAADPSLVPRCAQADNIIQT